MFLEENKCKNMKTMSKILYILTNISKVLLIIGFIMLSICVITCPFILKNISINQTEINAFNNKVEYTKEDDKIKLNYQDKEVYIEEKDEVEAFNYIINIFNNNENKIGVLVELVLVGACVSLFILFLITRKASKFFSNIMNEDTPFVIENFQLIRNVGYYMIATMGMSLLLNLLLSLISDIDLNINIEFSNIAAILFAFVLSYIFEYGYKLQNNLKVERITDDNNQK